MIVGSIVKPTKKIAYHWRYKVGIVIRICDGGVGGLPFTHKILWNNGDQTYEKPSALELVYESR